VDATLQEKQVRRAYALFSPVYDLLFDKIFYPGRVEAIKHLDAQPNDRILEVGIGTGLNLPLYPRHCHLTGIDLSVEMLRKAEEKVSDYGIRNVVLKVMDASAMTFAADQFDRVLATYVISAVPDPVAVLREMKRVCRPGGTIVILNHFKSGNTVIGAVEDALAPLCTRLGWKTNLALTPLLSAADLTPEVTARVNLLNGWRLVKCVNRK
jgi:phosphatidylethanolamine/phosphatidyl-N-methylethanolamine N-methyltransferase